MAEGKCEVSFYLFISGEDHFCFDVGFGKSFNMKGGRANYNGDVSFMSYQTDKWIKVSVKFGLGTNLTTDYTFSIDDSSVTMDKPYGTPSAYGGLILLNYNSSKSIFVDNIKIESSY